MLTANFQFVQTIEFAFYLWRFGLLCNLKWFYLTKSLQIANSLTLLFLSPTNFGGGGRYKLSAITSALSARSATAFDFSPNILKHRVKITSEDFEKSFSSEELAFIHSGIVLISFTIIFISLSDKDLHIQ